MKLYSYHGAPNPRRVYIFAAEKSLDLDIVNVDITKREQKSPEFLNKNPSGKIPVLELDDGRCIAETVAICRYLESLAPKPNLFGQDAFETAQIEMHHRFIEHELFTQVGTSWINGPIVASTGLIKPIEAAKQRSDSLVNDYYARLDRELGERSYIAGDRFTVADITAFCILDFASTLVGLKPGEQHQNLWGWFNRIAARESVVATN